MENSDLNNRNVSSGARYPFHAPDNYFDTLPQRVLSKVEGKNINENNSIFSKFFKPALGLLVSFIIVTGIIYVPIKLISPSKFKNVQSSNIMAEGLEFILTRTYSDLSLFEAIMSDQNIDNFSEVDMENVLLASFSEYELIQNDK